MDEVEDIEDVLYGQWDPNSNSQIPNLQSKGHK
jgi:hypothetical protein